MIIKWQMDVLESGRWPCKDPLGHDWPFKAFRRKLKGVFCGGYRFVLSDIIGDWKWLRESLHLPQWYGKLFCCHLCRAIKKFGLTSFVNCFTDAGIETRTSDEYLNNFDMLPALAQILGFHLTMALGDYMHIVNLGILQVVLASVLLEVCQEGAFGFTSISRKDIRLGLQLRRAFQVFSHWTKENFIEHSQQMFTISMLNLRQIPNFKGKAHNAMSVLFWLEALLCKHVAVDAHHAALRGIVVRAFCRQFR